MVAPRWQLAIQKALAANEKSVVIQLASIDPNCAVPQVRSHIFRSFLQASSLPSNPLIVTSTDVRTPKTSQIISNPHVQIVWWIEGTQEQYRISGLTSVIPHPEHALYTHFMHSTRARLSSPIISATESIPSKIPGTGGLAFAALEAEGFDWEKKRLEVFESMSGHMKASWCRPVPGSRLEKGHEEAESWPVTVVKPEDDVPPDSAEWNNWNMALNNFGLVVIDPTDVDYVELGVVPNRRTRFVKDTQGRWEDQAVVP